MIIRELLNRIVFEIVNQRDLDRANDAVDEAADNANEAARATDRQSSLFEALAAFCKRLRAF